MQRELFLDTKLHTENFLTAFGCAISGIVLIILKPLFGFDITWRRLVIPSSIVFWGGLSIFVCSILFLLLWKRYNPCVFVVSEALSKVKRTSRTNLRIVFTRPCVQPARQLWHHFSRCDLAPC